MTLIGIIAIVLLCVHNICGSVILLSSWKLQSSAQVSDSGSVVSTPVYNASSWYPVTVPATVMAGLIQNQVYDNLFYSNNLETVDGKQFDVPWWFRNEFMLSPDIKQQRVRIIFEGLNYRGDVWFNGINIGQTINVAGAFRYFEFDVTKSAVFSDTIPNVIAVSLNRPSDSIINSSSTDLSITFVDWAPPPPDGGLGIWRNVKLLTTGSLSVNYPMVVTKLTSLNLAHLSILAEVSNGRDVPVSGFLTGSIDGIGSFSTPISLEANEVLDVWFRNDSFPVLNVKNPLLWWPWQMGDQNLYKLTLQVTEQTGTVPSDSFTVNFGIREATSELNEKGFRQYRINGQKILIRGAGWSPDLFLRYSPDWQENHFKYVKDMYLNTIRLEGKLEDDHFFELADTYGILIMPGWCCCDAWQHWNKWGPEQFSIAKESMISQVKRLRIFPSAFVFVYSSDELPPTDVENLYLSVFKQYNWPNPTLAAASDRQSPITGQTGVKMSGPYSWEPPNYWYLDTSQYGGAYGFLTEGGPGENPLSMSSFALTFPSSDYWPINHIWDWHCGAQYGHFGNLRFYTPALDARYGSSSSAEEYLEKSQVMAYEAHRGMFEAYSRNKYTSTGVIQWMLNTAFPEMIWHLYDYYFDPSSTYFATKKSCEPLHILYSYDDNSAWIVNSLYTARNNLEATIQVFTIDGKKACEKIVAVDSILPDAPLLVSMIPDCSVSSTYFVRLILTDHASSEVISTNTYWLSTTKDELEWDKSNWYRTPCKTYADFSLLNTLPKVDLQISSETTNNNDNSSSTKVVVSNPSSSIAFFVHVSLINTDGNEVWPIIWDENYFTLFPNESLTVTATYNYADATKVSVEVWNNIVGNNEFSIVT